MSCKYAPCFITWTYSQRYVLFSQVEAEVNNNKKCRKMPDLVPIVRSASEIWNKNKMHFLNILNPLTSTLNKSKNLKCVSNWTKSEPKLVLNWTKNGVEKKLKLV